MSAKLTLTAAIVLSFLNVAFFLFYKGDFLKPKQLVSTPPPSAQTSKTIDLPVDKNHKAVNSIGLTYGFQGKITKIDPAPANEIYIVLDTSDSQTPVFATNPNTFINSQDSPGKALSTKDLKVGDNVLLTEVFDTTNNTWNLIGVAIKTK